MQLSPEKIIDLLNLEPLPIEGGYFKRTYISEDVFPTKHLPGRYPSLDYKSFCSAIYFLLTADTYSKIHRLPTDEIFHFYLGDPVEMLLLHENGDGQVVHIGNDLLNGYHPQFIVPKGTWQGSRLMSGGRFALLGTTMSPAFDYADFEEPGSLRELLERWPEEMHEVIRRVF